MQTIVPTHRGLKEFRVSPPHNEAACLQAISSLTFRVPRPFPFPLPRPLFCTILFSLASQALSLHKIVSAQLRSLPKGHHGRDMDRSGSGSSVRKAPRKRSSQSAAIGSSVLGPITSEQRSFPPLTRFCL
ncbi:hypothetical protein LX36DRAFT_155349 [Colletotrichum falcatum]|nr:hypothetical protein LX36DRAFT_155349 [Colletotrichum falcatum]